MPPERSRVWKILFKIGHSPFKKIYFICFHESRSFIKRQTSGTSSDNEWQRVVQRVTTNDNEWQRMTTGSTTSDNEWQRVVQRVTTSGTTSETSGTTSDNKWQQVTISGNFSFFQIREEPTTKHPMENPSNI